MLKKLLFVGFPIILILLVIYYQLGGFNRIEIQQVETDHYIIAGKTYKGRFQEDTLKNYFFQMNELVANDQLEGTVSVVSYGLTPSDSIHQLIGVRIHGSPYPLPKAIQLDTLLAARVLRAIIRAHPIVMPSPEQVVEKIKAYAQENAFSLKDYSVEQYIAEDEIWVDIPLSNDTH